MKALKAFEVARRRTGKPPVTVRWVTMLTLTLAHDLSLDRSGSRVKNDLFPDAPAGVVAYNFVIVSDPGHPK